MSRQSLTRMSRRSLARLLAPFLLLSAAVIAPVAMEAGGGCHGPDGSLYTEGEATVIRMDVCSFSPTIARVPVGTTVRFLNTSTIEHAVVGRSSTWGSDTLLAGREHSETFAAAGTYPFSCPLHPGMVGAIVVDDEAAGRAAAAVSASAAADPDASVPASVTDSGWMPIGTAALAGLGAGAIVGIIVAATLRRPRRTTDA